MISDLILEKYGAFQKQFDKEEIIFEQDALVRYYYQIVKGSVMMYTSTKNADHLLQGLFRSTESFGEPALFADFPYPATAITLEKTTIWLLEKNSFIKLIKENFQIHFEFTQQLAFRLRQKSILMSNLVYSSAEERLFILLKKLKFSFFGSNLAIKMLPITRRLLADMLGIRTETVIRQIQKLKNEGKIILIKGKIHL